MVRGALRWKLLALVTGIAALLLVIGCGSQDTTPAAPTPDVSKIIEQAVGSVPQGASAGDIQKLVSDSVTAAIAAQPGLTAADVQRIIDKSVADDDRQLLSAEDVQRVVDQSIRNLPAPEIDVNQLSGMVNRAVADAAPEGVSADEIGQIVQAQVSAGLAGTLTRGDIEDLVARAVEGAVGDQVSAADVEKIVTASLAATNKAIEAAAADAASAAQAATAAQTSAQQAVIVAKDAQAAAESEALPPLVVGNLNGFTGPLSDFATPLRNSVELAAAHVNRAGGVQGASMIIISRDTAVNPVQGVDSARALVDVENTVAIVGALSSGVTIAVAESVTIPKGSVLISGASTAPSITVLDDNDFVFRTAPSDASQGVVLGNLANDEGYATAGVLYINNAYGEGLANQFEQTFTSLGGTVTAKVPHEDAQPTYVSELEKATDGDPDVLVTISYPGQAEIYLREAIEGGYADTFLFVDGLKTPELMAKLDAAAIEGTLGTAPGGPDRPEKAAFESAYLGEFGYPVSHPFMAEHYDAAVLIALAAAKAGSTTDSAAIRDALREVANGPGEIVGPGRDGIARAFSLIAAGRDINYEGASGIVDLDANGDVFGPIEIWKVEGGEIVSTGRFETP